MPDEPAPDVSPLRSALAAAWTASAPMAVSALAAMLASGIRVPALQDALPITLLAVVSVQAVGLLIARQKGGSERARGWWMVLACTSLLLPALALQASMARSPFVSLGSGSAGNLMLATGEVLALLACMFIWTASVCGDDPSWAPLLWCPAALLTPAVIGSGRGDLTEHAALQALAFALAVSAVAVAAGQLAAPHSRLAIAAVAVVGELLLLLVVRRGPSFAEAHGAIAPVMAMLLVLVAIGSVVAIQLAAVAGRRFITGTTTVRGSAIQPARPLRTGMEREARIAPERPSTDAAPGGNREPRRTGLEPKVSRRSVPPTRR